MSFHLKVAGLLLVASYASPIASRADTQPAHRVHSQEEGFATTVALRYAGASAAGSSRCHSGGCATSDI